MNGIHPIKVITFKEHPMYYFFIKISGNSLYLVYYVAIICTSNGIRLLVMVLKLKHH